MDILNARKDIYDIAKSKGFYFPNKSDLHTLADIAKEAYVDYPLHRWFFNGKYDFKSSFDIMHYILKTMYNKAIIYADSDNPNGFLIALLPSTSQNSDFDFLINVGIKIIFRNGLDTIKKLSLFDKWTGEVGEQFTHNKDIYLYNICVKKNIQHHGIATNLLSPIIEYCDRTKNICYLDTNLATNVTFYKHIGFRLLLETKIPHSDVSHFSMGYNM